MDANKTGSLSVALVATSRNGDEFRLRNATFEIYGCGDNYSGMYPYGGSGGSYVSTCTTQSVSSEDDLDASSITKRLVPGYYTVTLQGDWYLEQASASGWHRVDRAVLLTAVSQSAYVWDGGQAQVIYSFGAGGDLIDFRHGDIQIGIQVEHPGDHDCYYGGYSGYGGYAGTGSCSEPAGSPAPPTAGAGGN